MNEKETQGSVEMTGHLDHVEQSQLSGNSSVTEDLNPVPLAACTHSHTNDQQKQKGEFNTLQLIEPWTDVKHVTFLSLTFFVLGVYFLLLRSSPARQSGGGDEEGQ